jgi:2-desacetyl-2-hydroxyethyl bacteriochlorophyllide A dehydrogenase
VRRQALVFVGPGRVEVVDEEQAPPGAGEVLVRTRVSAVSAGTERLVFRGELPRGLPLDESLPALAGASSSYPARFGYAAVGDVAAVGPGVDATWTGRRVFAFAPHASAFAARAADVLPVPDGLDAERAALYANMETAVTLALDGAPRVGERVAVVGQGTVGLLATAVLARFPLQTLVVVDAAPARARLGLALGADAAVTDAAAARVALGAAGADLTFELTGDPAALDVAVAVTGREGRVVVGSFYGSRRAPVDLGAHFHRGRLTIASSQVSHLPPALTGRWDRARRTEVTWRELARVDVAPLISHRFALGRAAEAYARLDAGPSQASQILLTYE